MTQVTTGWPYSAAEIAELRRREQLAKQIADTLDEAFPAGGLEDKSRILRMTLDELGSRQG